MSIGKVIAIKSDRYHLDISYSGVCGIGRRWRPKLAGQASRIRRLRLRNAQ